MPSNLALAPFTANDNTQAAYPVAAVFNGVRHTNNAFDNGGAYQSGVDMSASNPKIITRNFSFPITVNEIGVFTVNDDYDYDVDPTESDTFAATGLQAFKVEYWTGSAWANLVPPVVGNNKVYRRFTGLNVQTDKVRLYMTESLSGAALVAEFEIIGDYVAPAAGGGGAGQRHGGFSGYGAR